MNDFEYEEIFSFFNESVAIRFFIFLISFNIIFDSADKVAPLRRVAGSLIDNSCNNELTSLSPAVNVSFMQVTISEMVVFTSSILKLSL